MNPNRLPHTTRRRRGAHSFPPKAPEAAGGARLPSPGELVEELEVLRRPLTLDPEQRTVFRP